MSDQTILINDDMKKTAESTGKRWTEEISVRSTDLADTLGRLGREAAVRKITIKNARGRTMAEIPLALGAAGMLILGPWTAAVLVAAWLGRVSILIEYEEAPATMDAALKQVSDSLDKTAGAIEANIKSV